MGLAYPASFEAFDQLRVLLDGPPHLRLRGAEALAGWAAAYLRLEGFAHTPKFIKVPGDLFAGVPDEGRVVALEGFLGCMDTRARDVRKCARALLASESGSPPPFQLVRARRILDQLRSELTTP